MRLGILLIVPFFVGCSFFSKHRTPEIKNYNTEEKVYKMFEVANKQLDKNNYRAAIQEYNKVLSQKPTSDLEAVIYYNIGYANENLKKCGNAVNSYKKTVQLTRNKQTRMYAQAHYRMSFAYKCVGQSDKVIVSLLTAYKYSRYLPVEVAKAEIPARLAAAYASNGNHETARQYFDKAQEGIRFINKEFSDPFQKRDMLAKTLYFMGKLNILDIKRIKANEYLNSVSNLQGYLMQAAELDSPKWSKLASNELIAAYKNTWDLVNNVQQQRSDDADMDKREILRKRHEIVNRALDNIIELKKSSFPDTKETKLIKNLNYNLKREEGKLRNYLAKNINGNDLTPEALDRSGVRRQGKTHNPNPKLEERVRPQKRPAKKKDPNL